MLCIRVGERTEECITNVRGFFDFNYREEWFKDPFVRKVVEQIDKSQVCDGFIKSPVFGVISPSRLSSGTKALIMMKFLPDKVIYATRCGDNCAPLILELAESQDITILLHHCMIFPDSMHAIFKESGKEVFSCDEYIEEYYRCRDQLRKF